MLLTLWEDIRTWNESLKKHCEKRLLWSDNYTQCLQNLQFRLTQVKKNRQTHLLLLLLRLWFLISYLLSNQIFHYSRCITPKPVWSLRGPSARYWARATHTASMLLLARSSGKPLAILCPIWLTRELNLRPPAPKEKTLPLNRQSGIIITIAYVIIIEL